MEQYDLLVIGGGPAGLSAAVNGRRRNKRVLLVGKEKVSSKLRQAHRVDNYLGFTAISGAGPGRQLPGACAGGRGRTERR